MSADFYVISITDEHGPGNMFGPGTWDQCVAKGKKWIRKLLPGNITDEDGEVELEVFEDDGVWTEAKYGVDGVYIIQSQPF